MTVNRNLMPLRAFTNVSAPTTRRSLRLPWRIVAASAVAAVLFALAVLALTIRSSHGQVVWSDGIAYFLYARSAVVDLDLDLTDEFAYLDPQFPPDSRAMEPLRKWSSRSADGKLRPPWPVGAGLIMTPFYAVGYGLERLSAALSGRSANSYGVIPQCAFALGSTAFGLLGFWCLVLMCREIADERFAYLASLGVTLCGPVVFFVFFHPSMAHASSFGLVTLMTLIWLRGWKYGTNLRTMLALGLLLGVAITVRYQNALFGILPAALTLKDWRRVGLRIAAMQALVGLAACLLPVLVLLHGQFKMSTGHGQTSFAAAQYPIDFTSPYFFDVLFSCRHGAFHWAPVLGIGALGLLWAAYRRNGWAAVLLIAFAAHAYLIGGFGLSKVAYGDNPLPPGWLNHWDNAPSFGMRYLTECAPFFALGLGFLMQGTRARIKSSVWAVGLSLFALWNGLLIIAYGLETITRSRCLPYADMLTGIGAALRTLVLHQP
jgi:hypothetical protein